MTSTQHTRIIYKIKYLKKHKKHLQKRIISSTDQDIKNQTHRDIQETDYALKEWVKFGKLLGINPKRL